MNDSIVTIILESVAELNASLDEPLPVHLGADMPLFGREGMLDSLGLVTLISSVEMGIEDRMGRSIRLADEKAVSETRSPFRTVRTLAEFAERQLADPSGPVS